jgi:sulfite exporter TauE/SafE
MIGLLGAALMAGLVGSPHCIGMCGGFAVLCGRRVPDTAVWHAGRLTSYALLGALAGAFGSMVPGPSWVAAIVSLGLMIWFSAALAGLVPEPRIVIPGLKRLGTAMAGDAGLSSRYAFGIVNGFLPCGLVYAALSVPVATTHPGWGALAMVAFGIGTAPVLSAVALGVQRIVARDIRVRRAIAAGVLVAGLWSIGMRQGILGSQAMHGMHEHQMHQPGQPPAPHDTTHDGT